MRRARYQFETDRRYFAWVVAVKLFGLPGFGESSEVVKTTFATPFVLDADGKTLVPSHHLEAVIFLNPDKPYDMQIIQDCGIVQIKGEYEIPNRKSVCLWCEFGEQVGWTRYQPLEKCETIPAGAYPVEPLVVPTRHVSGIIFQPDQVMFEGNVVKLTRRSLQILRHLNEHFTESVSLESLRNAIREWRGRTLDEKMVQSMREAISRLRLALKPAGLLVSDQDGQNGWCLRLMPV